MPFYEYRCQDCGRKFETFVRTMDAPAGQCPSCGSAKVARQMSVFGVGAAAEPARPAGGCGGCAQSGTCPMAQ